MDGHPVPFPSVSRFADDMSPERRADDRTPHGRVNSSPSMPEWPLPMTHSGTRPRLNPLDLAVARPGTPSPFSAKFAHPLPSPAFTSAQNSPSRKDGCYHSPRTNSSSPRRASTLLTPPLTPSSSFNSASTVATESEFGGDGDVVPSTPSDGGSPLTWNKLRLRRKSAMDLCHTEESAVGYGQGVVDDRGDASEQLAVLLKGMDLTPRFEKKMELGEKDVGVASERDRSEELDQDATRFLLVYNASRVADTTIRTALCRTGAKVSRALQLQSNTILFMFYDLRDAVRAANWLDGKTLSELGGNDLRLTSPTTGALGSSLGDTHTAERDLPFKVEFTTRAQLEKFATPPAPHAFIGTESALLIKVYADICPISHDELRRLLASLGDLAHFRAASPSVVRAVKAKARASPTAKTAHDPQVFFADYYDTNCATTARQTLDGRTLFHTRLSVYWASDVERMVDEDAEKDAESQDTMPYPLMSYGSLNSSPGFFDLSSPPRSSVPLPVPDSPTPTRGVPVDFHFRPRTMSGSEATVCPDSGRVGGSPPPGLFFDGTSRYPPTPDRHRSLSSEHDTSNYQYSAYPFGAPSTSLQQPYQPPMSDGLYMAPAGGYQYAQPYPPVNTYGMSLNAAYAGLREPWYPGAPSSRDYTAPTGYPSSVRDSIPRSYGKKHARGGRRADREPDFNQAFDDRYDKFGGAFGEAGLEKGQVSEKNQLNLEMIEAGLDTRTTVMVKNIPNKMSDRDLLEFINRTSARRIDFLYLRMDFQNGCNVGYAFVNFITVQDLLYFAKTQLGVKWNMYSSEKVLQMSYANYQGKEALVEKFKNSCIMDEREAWRPKIFFSGGPHEGLPEPFPPPTHLRRKERSASNRGALYTPGVHHFAQGPQYGGGRAWAPRFA